MSSLTPRLLLLMMQLAVVCPANAQDLRALIGGIVQGTVRLDESRQRQNAFELQRRRISEAAGSQILPPTHVLLPDQTPDADRPARGAVGRYAVDGRNLYDPVDPKTLPREFVCTPSDRFAGSSWCRSRTKVRGAPVATSMLISSAGKIVYLNKVYEAATFAPRDVVDEIDRLSKRHRAAPRILRAPPGSTVEAVIAIWGAAALEPVDQGTRALLANGSTVDAGILVDFLHNARESARRGLPVFRLAGGPGTFWSARIDPDGHGSLRFGMSDAGSFDGPPAAVPSAGGAAAARPVLVPQAAGPEPSDPARGRQDASDRQVADARRVLDEATAFSKTDPGGPDALDLVQAISDLNAVLGERNRDMIGRRAQALTAALQRNPRFAAFQTERADAMKRRNAQAVGDAVRQAQGYRAFLAASVTADPTSSNVSTLLPLIKRLDAAVATPDAERLGSLNGAVDLAIRQAGLQDAYAAAATKATTMVAPAEGVTGVGPFSAGSQIVPRSDEGPGKAAAIPDDQRIKTQKLAALRADNRDSAKTSTSKIDDEIKEYVAKPSETALFAQQFPEFADWLDGETSAGWSLSGETFELADYGVVDWHGRPLSVPMTRVTFRLRNPARGSDKTSCFVFGRIDDPGANAARDPIAVPCDDAAPLMRWRTSHAFTSRWNID